MGRLEDVALVGVVLGFLGILALPFLLKKPQSASGASGVSGTSVVSGVSAPSTGGWSNDEGWTFQRDPDGFIVQAHVKRRVDFQ